jgi:actin-related protein
LVKAIPKLTLLRNNFNCKKKMGDEETHPVVIDLGSGNTYAGFGGDDQPRCAFPTIVGRKSKAYAVIEGGAAMSGGIDKTYIGDEAQSNRNYLTIERPVKHGIIHDWNDVEKIYHHIYYNELRVAPEEHPLLLTEPSFSPHAQREKNLQIMIETFNVPAVGFINQGVATLYASGRHCAYNVCIGDGVVQGIPIEGNLSPHSIETNCVFNIKLF